LYLGTFPMRSTVALTAFTDHVVHPIHSIVLQRIAVACDVFFPRKHPPGFLSMSHRFARAPFSFSLGRECAIRKSGIGEMTLEKIG
jgi:hypothetical protein